MNHPMKPADITDDNFHAIAKELFACQCRYLSGYALSMAEGYGDDDTDYFRTALDATQRLMDISYDGSRDDLVTFLFSPRVAEPNYQTLADIISAGGLCDELNAYESLIYESEGI